MNAHQTTRRHESKAEGNSTNFLGGAGTRHVNTHFHFVKELHGDDNVIVTAHREGDDNEADVMTKNATRAEFERCSPRVLAEVPEDLMEKSKNRRGVKGMNFWVSELHQHVSKECSVE